MTQTDIALLLADAADEVEIGIAPVQAVMRGGRRRRARRWAVAATTALVLAGSTGATLALTGMPGGHGDRGAPVATRPASPEARHVFEPQETELSRGVYKGKPWSVQLQVWGAPRNRTEAARQFDAMVEEKLYVAGVTKPADLVGKMSFFAIKRYGTDRQQVLYDTVNKPGHLAGTDLESASVPMKADDSRQPLVVGMVAKTAREVTCRWKDGTTSVARKGPVAYRHNIPDPAIVPVDGFTAANWFVCMAPDGTSAQSAEVTK
ncbi:hypothetical protein [Streptomyces sp. HUAS TT20]|uniref:hypothetical protein n=1 Tax=Streptomyces sp. HUAS TT20 TaxID=3447509 RepID=UPI0021D9441F|nr:hypothetical protein [Streptomyces sp. HUAS 15-9]UXY27257.1 hypothetical protein N8I87_12110 [Streptomyces sp. HUAS 15-9]